MTQRNEMFWRLLWKDAKTLQPLSIALLAGIVGLNFLIPIGSWLTDSRYSLTPYTMIWILLPNLMALGAPAMLVGGEEETGTLQWLRTLPASWQNIVDSKFVAAFLGLSVVWLIASVAMFTVYLNWSGSVSLTADEMLSAWGVCKLLFFSCLLLLMGFGSAYLFRSPITALIALVPIVSGVYYGLFAAVGVYIQGRLDYHTVYTGTTNQWIVVIIAAVAFLVALWFVQRALGKRRLTLSIDGNPVTQRIESARSAYRPPTVVGLGQPSETYAMHWQQARQVGPATIALAVLASVAMMLMVTLRAQSFSAAQAIVAFCPMIICLSALWLGSLVFYGDNVRGRNAFFADRGLSPTRVWWTRMAIPLAGCLVVCALSLLQMLVPDARPRIPVWAILFAFASGQVVSQAATRPIMCFFAAPVYALLSLLFLSRVLRYQRYEWALILFCVIALFATWHLCRRWLDGRIERYHLRMLGYSALAIIVPLAAVIGYRIATMPSYRPQWTANILQQTERYKVDFSNMSPEEINLYYRDQPSGITSYECFRWGSSSPSYLDAQFETLEQVEAALRQELTGEDEITAHISASQIGELLNPSYSAWDRGQIQVNRIKRLRYDAIRVALSWVARIRRSASKGHVNLYWLNESAEPAEQAVVRILTNQPQTIGTPKEVAELVALIPDADLRRESRKATLLAEWRRIHDISLLDPLPGFLRFEQMRAERFQTEFTADVLEDLEKQLPEASSEDMDYRQYLSREYHGLDGGVSLAPTNTANAACLNWTIDHENSIATLRDRFPSTNSTVEPQANLNL